MVADTAWLASQCSASTASLGCKQRQALHVSDEWVACQPYARNMPLDNSWDARLTGDQRCWVFNGSARPWSRTDPTTSAEKCDMKPTSVTRLSCMWLHSPLFAPSLCQCLHFCCYLGGERRSEQGHFHQRSTVHTFSSFYPFSWPLLMSPRY